MNTDTNISPAPRPDLSTILWRLSGPFFLFSGLLASIMALSWTFLLPRYTRIEVGGVLRSAREIRTYKDELTAQIAGKEEDRRQAVLAVHDAQYETLKELRRTHVTLDQLRTMITDAAMKVTGKADVIDFAAFAYDPQMKTLVIRGDVRNVETRSMTVLSQFTQALKDLPLIASATTPAFTREEDPKTGFHSPFEITLTLK